MHWSDEQFIELKKNGFKYAVRPHYMGSCEGGQEAPQGLGKFNDLWEVSYIKRSVELGYKVCITSPYTEYQHLVMAFKLDGERDFWVIGYFCNLEESYNTTRKERTDKKKSAQFEKELAEYKKSIGVKVGPISGKQYGLLMAFAYKYAMRPLCTPPAPLDMKNNKT